MAGFTLRKSDTPPMVEEWTKAATSDTGAIGDILYWNAGADAATVGAAATESTDRVGILMEASVAAQTTVKVQIPTPDQLWEVESANASNTSHNGMNMILTDQNTVNNTGSNDTSSEALLVQVNTIGATSDKRLLCRFSQMGNGLSNM